MRTQRKTPEEVAQIIGLDNYLGRLGLPRHSVFSFFFFFWPPSTACGILIPDHGLNLCPLQWKCGVLTAGPPGKSPRHSVFSL